MKGAEELLRLLGQGRMAIWPTSARCSARGSPFRGLVLHQRSHLSEEVGVAKPAYSCCLNRLGCTRPERVVGDSIASDIRGGAAAGIVTCWFNPHGAPNLSDITPDYEIRRLSQLPELLGC